MSNTALQILKENEPTLMALMALNATPGVDVKAMVMQEISYFEEHAMMKPGLLECTPDSVLLCVRRALKNNLTLDPDAGLVYLIPSSVKNAQGQWDKILTSPRTVNGELSVAYQTGTLVDHERPTVEYDEAGRVTRVVVILGRPAVGGGVRWETVFYDKNYFKKWMEASHKKNARGKQDADAATLNYANPLYRSHNGSIDPEFAIAKALKHSIGKLGTNPNAKFSGKITLSKEKMVANADESEFTEVEILEGGEL